MSDPAYQLVAGASGKFGPSWLARWARAHGRKLTIDGQPDPAGWIVEQHKRLCEMP